MSVPRILWFLPVVPVVFAGPTFGEDWQWTRIGWEGMRVWSAVSPPDSGDVIYVSICEGPDRGVHKSTDGGLTWR